MAKNDREIRIGGAPVVFAIGIIDMADEVYRYVVVTQDPGTGKARVTTVRHLVDTEEPEDRGSEFDCDGYPTQTRENAMSAALELAGYPPLDRPVY